MARYLKENQATMFSLLSNVSECLKDEGTLDIYCQFTAR